MHQIMSKPLTPKHDQSSLVPFVPHLNEENQSSIIKYLEIMFTMVRRTKKMQFEMLPL